VVTMKNAVFWNVTPYGSCKNRRFGGMYRGVRRLPVIANVPSSSILVTLMMEAIGFSESCVLNKSHTA
jgi:hypothetical protein